MEKGYRDVKEEGIKEKTGKGMEEWGKILDRWNLKEKGHTGGGAISS